MPIPRVLREMLNLPTAAFAEHFVLDYIRQRTKQMRNVTIKEDRYGNLIVRYRHNAKSIKPIVFSAHTDHPGFVAREMLDGRTLLADFRGGVDASYFPDTPVAFFVDGKWIPGRVERVVRAKTIYRPVGEMKLPEDVRIRIGTQVPAGSIGMWKLPDAVERSGRVFARGCDDIAGAAAMVELLARLSKKSPAADVICLFTRAEEVGFIGAIGACRAKTLPKTSPIIAIETSSDRGGFATIGDGPVLRVGDKATIFTPELTAFADRVGKRLAKRRKTFRFQRKLMAGGTCESTAFLSYGYDTTGMCLALGNYHNMDVDRHKIAAESVSLNDWRQMVDWFEALVLERPTYKNRFDATLKREMESRFKRWAPLF